MRWSREVFPLIIRLAPVQIVLDWVIRWNLTQDLMIPDKSLSINEGAITVLGWQSCTDKGQLFQGDSGCSGERISL